MTDTNTRIQKILAQASQEQEAAKLAAEAKRNADAQSAKVTESVKSKWSVDKEVVRAILADFKSRLASINFDLTLEDIRHIAGSATVAQCKVRGTVKGKAMEIGINIHPDGAIHTFVTGGRVGDMQIQLVSPSVTNVLTADKTAYESMILDLIE